MYPYSSYICKGCIISMCCSEACDRVILNIITQQGKKYRVNPKGQIIGGWELKPSDNWIMLGIDHVKRFEFIPFSELIPKNIEEFKTWKNGKSQWTVRDLDRGTIRKWGPVHLQGINSMYFDIN